MDTMLLKLLLIVIIVGACDYPLYTFFLEEERKAKGDYTLLMYVLMMLFVMPLVWGAIIL